MAHSKKTEGKIPPAVQLRYAKGDLIIKEGDYGISIYEIFSGKVGIFIDAESAEVMVAAKGPGDIFGEMVFLGGVNIPRSASARALEDCHLEAWSSTLLLTDYRKMPPILRLITDKALNRLGRINKAISRLGLKEMEADKGKAQDSSKTWGGKRETDPQEGELYGRAMDISKGGMKLVVKTSNSLKFSHVPGDKFFIKINLTPDYELNTTTKIVNIEKGQTAATIHLGMVFTHMNQEDQKKLGFFLLA
jgi:CRP-like cAMP-binding protein